MTRPTASKWWPFPRELVSTSVRPFLRSFSRTLTSWNEWKSSEGPPWRRPPSTCVPKITATNTMRLRPGHILSRPLHSYVLMFWWCFLLLWNRSLWSEADWRRFFPNARKSTQRRACTSSQSSKSSLPCRSGYWYVFPWGAVRPAGRVRDFVVVVHIRLRTDINRETRSLL